MRRIVLLALSHAAVLLIGFGLGVYFLPILTAPPAPAQQVVQAAAAGARYHAAFRRDLPGSDPLHWGEGKVSVGPEAVTFSGRMAPGPAYRLYLVPEYVDTHAAFVQAKSRSLAVGDIKTFEGFIVPLVPGTRIDDYTTVVVWCEAFSQFITAARYR
jgi:hypothetical protein